MKKTWIQLRDESALFTDKLGMSMDEAAIDIVTSLRFHGFTTVLSCGGHSDRPSGGPYVLMIHPESRRLCESSKDHNTRKVARQMTAGAAMELYRLLESFYLSRDSSYGVQIIIQLMGDDAFRISCHSGRLMAEVLEMESEERHVLLEAYQREVSIFSDFLRK